MPCAFPGKESYGRLQDTYTTVTRTLARQLHGHLHDSYMDTCTTVTRALTRQLHGHLHDSYTGSCTTVTRMSIMLHGLSILHRPPHVDKSRTRIKFKICLEFGLSQIYIYNTLYLIIVFLLPILHLMIKLFYAIA
jgi:hypothetical protein